MSERLAPRQASAIPLLVLVLSLASACCTWREPVATHTVVGAPPETHVAPPTRTPEPRLLLALTATPSSAQPVSLTVTPIPEARVFSATLQIAASRTELAVGETLTVAVTLRDDSVGCRFGTIDLVLSQRDRDVFAPAPDTVTSPGTRAVFTLTAVHPGTVALYAYAFGEHNCGYSPSDWYWAGVGRTSDPIVVVGPVAGAVLTRTPGAFAAPTVPGATATRTPAPTATPTQAPTVPAQIVSFTAGPDAIERGGTVTLTWDVRGATGVGITRLSEQGDIFVETEALGLPPRGSIALQVPQEHVESVKYYLGARDANGVLYRAYVSVGIVCPYDEHLAPRCPLTRDRVWAAYESFERGHMVWRGDVCEIYVLYDDGRYDSYEDTWQEGDLVDIQGAPPPGLCARVRGFGNLYASQPLLQERLGWATAIEVGYMMTVETIPGGSGRYPGTSTYFTLPDNRVVNLYPFSSTWQLVP